MTRMKKINQESGQIIVLLAVSLLVLLIVAALAVDGGMIYSERRYIQNVADSASLAGGGAILNSFEFNKVTGATFGCSSANINTAIQGAKDSVEDVASRHNINDLQYYGLFYDANDVVDFSHGYAIVCNEAKDYLDVQVKITSEISTSFAHLFLFNDLVTTNLAISRAQPKYNIGRGNAIVSLSPDCQNNTDGMEYTGTGDITLYGGGAHSNSCITGSGNISVVSDEGSGSITLNYADATTNGGAEFQPDPIHVEEPFIIVYPEEPTCASAGSLSGSTYSPGEYSKIKITSGTYTFAPGLYCLTGNDVNTLEITGGDVTGNGVTFFIKDGNVRITGNAIVKLKARIDKSDLSGILFYMAKSNDGIINLVGNDDSYFSGTILAPSGSILLGGTSSLANPEDPEDMTGCTELLDVNGKPIPNLDTDDPDDSLCEPLCKLILDSNGDPIPDPDPDNPDGYLCQAGTFSVQLIGWYVKVVGTSNIDIIYDESNLNFVKGQMYLLK